MSIDDHYVGFDVLDASLEGKPRARAACSLATILLVQDSEVESTTVANRSECRAPWLAPKSASSLQPDLQADGNPRSQ
jgi:hypothetical protein